VRYSTDVTAAANPFFFSALRSFAAKPAHIPLEDIDDSDRREDESKFKHLAHSYRLVHIRQ
jgi:hypothetical protein